ncbi:MAG: FHA domain-containing protein [Bryobacteraceae bacterium]|nr:FHA domain-containing protein [Bryobacteraceae bacterium]
MSDASEPFPRYYENAGTMRGEQQTTTERHINGDEIIAEVLRNAEAGLFRMRRTVVLPCVFHVYLHPSAFDAIRPVLTALRTEARQALRERLDEMNHRSEPSKIARLFGLEKKEAPRDFRILDSEYTIEFYPDVEGSLETGDIEIRSELAAAPPPNFEGDMTQRITRKQGGVSYSAPAPEPADPEATSAVSRPASATTGASIVGWLRYEEQGNPIEFPVTKDEIAVGRGGKAVWVDVRLNAPPDISREHLRIRRDRSGNAYITDLSQFGTVVNGQTLQSGSESVLSPKATIILAGIVTLEWEKA